MRRAILLLFIGGLLAGTAWYFTSNITPPAPETPPLHGPFELPLFPTAVKQSGSAPIFIAPVKPDDQRLGWRFQIVEDYLKHGKRDPHTDPDAVEALRLFASISPANPAAPEYDEIYDAAYKAVQKGSSDPCVRFIFIYSKIKTENKHAPNYFPEWEKATKEMVEQKRNPGLTMLALSEYSFLLHTAYYNRQTKQVPGEIDALCKSALDQALKLVPTFAGDPQAPHTEIAILFQNMGIASKVVFGDRKKIFDAFVAIVSSNPALAAKLEGAFYTDYAWDARGGDFAAQVKDSQWELFGERLKISYKASERAFSLDPKDAMPARNLITTSLGLGADDTHIDKWFKTAIQLEPGNKSAYSAREGTLLPRWGGTAQDAIKLGQDCLKRAQADPKNFGHLAGILVEAHCDLAEEWDWNNPPGGYWLQKGVWPDMKAAFKVLMEIRPNSRKYKTEYAYKAWRCQQWKEAQEIFKSLDNPVYSIFGGEAKYKQAVSEAAGK